MYLHLWERTRRRNFRQGESEVECPWYAVHGVGNRRTVKVHGREMFQLTLKRNADHLHQIHSQSGTWLL